jgi:ribosomal-protein-alanine N-acetyltransferase
MIVPVELLTPRLRVRRHHMQDIEAFVRFMADAELTHFLLFTEEQKTAERARDMVEAVIAAYDGDDPICSLTIADRASDTYVGSCGLAVVEGAEGPEVYYTLIREAQGRGYATEAVSALLDHAFREAQVKEVFAHVSQANLASIRVVERLGMAAVGPAPHLGPKGLRFRVSRDRWLGRAAR